MPKINYDSKEDILFLSKEQKVKESIDVGDFIIDIDNKGFVIAIEILNASENLQIDKEQLTSLEEGKINVAYKPNQTIISLFLKLKGKEKDIAIPLQLSLGHDKVSRDKTIFATA